MIIIGIHLGTTSMCAAICRPPDGRAEMIPDRDGGAHTTPALVSFNKGALPVVGRAALPFKALDPDNTCHGVKWLLGRTYTSTHLEFGSCCSAKVVKKSNGDDVPMLQIVDERGEERQISAGEVTTMMLRELCASAEAFLGKKIDRCVLTCPAEFADSQRQALRDAGASAGLNVARVINEPTAASIAYGLQNGSDDSARNVVIFHLGGGTCDVSVMNIEEGIFEVLCTASDSQLGGAAFDQRLMNVVALEFSQKNKLHSGGSGGGALLTKKDPAALERLRAACECAKRRLSTGSETSIDLKALFEGHDLRCSITRARFEEVCDDFFRTMTKLLERALKDARMDKKHVHDVVLTGGSTRMPKVQQLVSDFFGGGSSSKTKLHNQIPPEEVVAIGAAAQAFVLVGGSPTVAVEAIVTSAEKVAVDSGGGEDEKNNNNNKVAPPPPEKPRGLPAATPASAASESVSQLRNTHTQGIEAAAVYTPIADFVRDFDPGSTTCSEYVRLGAAHLPGVERIEDVIAESAKMAQSRLEAGVDIGSMTPPQLFAVIVYTFDLCLISPSLAGQSDKNFYFQVNKVLQARDPEKIKHLSGYLHFLMGGLQALPDFHGTVYRGLTRGAVSIVTSNYELGRKIHWSGLSSTSEDFKYAAMMADAGGIVMRIKVKSGKKLGGASALPAEKEVLLMPNFPLTVVSEVVLDAAASGGTLVIDLVETPKEKTYVF